MTALQRIARMFRVRYDQAEDLLHNERAAKLTLSRRSVLGAAATLATGAAFGFYKQLDHLPWNDPNYLYLTASSPYRSYARVAVLRSADTWDVSGNAARMRQPIKFPVFTGLGDGEKANRIVVSGANGHELAHANMFPEIGFAPGMILDLRSLTVTCDGAGIIVGGEAGAETTPNT